MQLDTFMEDYQDDVVNIIYESFVLEIVYPP